VRQDSQVPLTPAVIDAPCRWCGIRALIVVLDLGAQPSSDLFPRPADPQPDPVWPLRMAQCGGCGLAQLVEDPGTVEEPLGIEPRALVEQARDAVGRVAASGLIAPGRSVAEFDSPHGGSWRDLLGAAGCDDRTDRDGPVDLVVDVFGLMHDAEQADALARRIARLAPGGTLLVQYHSLESIVRQRQWNALRHGHMAYYSTTWMARALSTSGLTPTRAWTFDLYGGTVLLAAQRAAEAPVPDDSTLAGLRRGDDGLDPSALGAAASAAIDELAGWLRAHRDAGRTVVGYGAASRAVPLLVAAGIGPDLLAAVADGSAAKHGRTMPGARIPIIAPDDLIRRRPDVVLLFVPDLLAEVRDALPEVERSGGRWAVSEPRPRLVDPR
jgi:hypothetical protein